MKKHKTKIIIAAVLLLILTLAFWYGGSSPSLHGFAPNGVPEPIETQSDTGASLKEQADSTDDSTAAESEVFKGEEKSAQNSANGTDFSSVSSPVDAANNDKTESNSASDEKAVSPEVQGNESDKSDEKLTCTLSVRCDTVLKNLSLLDPEKTELIPKNGIIYPERTVIFYEGESVFNLLMREMKQNKIHMEFVNTPIYNSAYIEAIGNLYEFDCGELSGWMYRVNDIFPNYGCSNYILKSGDKVEWIYTCDLGKDIGGDYSTRNGR